jgi:drug/metabolite transporter (DMT)-like permease
MSSARIEASPAPPVAVLGVLRSPGLALALAALFWSGNFVAGRALRDQIDPATLNFSRWLIALLLLAPFIWRDLRRSWPLLVRHWRLVLGLGATGIAAFHTLVYLALETTTATNALLTLSLTPIVILAGAALSGSERPVKRQLVGALVSIAGAVVLITHGDVALLTSVALNRGDLWMVVAILIWAAYSLLLRRRPADLPHGVALAGSIVAGLVLLAPLVLLTGRTTLAVFASPSIALSVGYIAVFASVAAFLLWSYGLSALGPTRAGQFILLMPVFGAALAAITLGETPTLAEICGGALVLAGIMAVERRA